MRVPIRNLIPYLEFLVERIQVGISLDQLCEEIEQKWGCASGLPMTPRGLKSLASGDGMFGSWWRKKMMEIWKEEIDELWKRAKAP